jgi:cell division protein FtsB
VTQAPGKGRNPSQTPASAVIRGKAVTRSTRPSLTALIYYAAAFALSTYFTFAAVQGDFGLFRRVEIQAEAETLTFDLDRLKAEIAALENHTRRLSDDFLDLDLLDQQARSILGLLRTDEIVIR